MHEKTTCMMLKPETDTTAAKESVNPGMHRIISRMSVVDDALVDRFIQDQEGGARPSWLGFFHKRATVLGASDSPFAHAPENTQTCTYFFIPTINP